MANRTRFSNDTVTAGKFVEIGRKSVDLRARLQRVAQLVSSSENNSSIHGIEQITSDNYITVEEKRKLKDEWEHIQAAYASTVATVTSLGVSPEEFISFQTAYGALKDKIDVILSDMTKPSTVDGSLDLSLQAYESAATILQNWINAYNNSLTADISSYRLDVESKPASPTFEDTITFTAHIYIDNVDKTDELINNYKNEAGLCPDLFIWDISGTSDDESLMESSLGKKSFSVACSSFTNDSIKVFFSSKLNVG